MMTSEKFAALEKFITLARQGVFDVRHYMAAGYGLMAIVLVLVSQTNLQARVIDPDADFARMTDSRTAQSKTATLKTEGLKTAKTSASTDASSDHGRTKTATLTSVPKDFKLSLLAPKVTKDTPKLTRLASIGANAPIIEYSPKDRTSCSLEAARAAANGDTSKISPCIKALLSGDEDALVDLPTKMSSFFIETMNSDAPPEEMGKIMINSMMAMMEAMSNGVKGSDDPAPEKTATAP